MIHLILTLCLKQLKIRYNQSNVQRYLYQKNIARLWNGLENFTTDIDHRPNIY